MLDIALSNALMATVLALLAAGVGYVYRRPALVHSLWLLVLLKLITPPVRLIPVVFPGGPEIVTGESAPGKGLWQPSGQIFTAAVSDSVVEMPGAMQLKPQPMPEEVKPLVQPAPAGSTATVVLPKSDAEEGQEPQTGHSQTGLSWKPVCAAIWLAGSLIWLTAVLWRIHRFSRFLHYAKPALPEIADQAQNLARRIGLKNCPAVWLVPGPVSPMLWALGGKPRLLIPAELWSRLNEEQRAALLVHELAHYRRRDHWVRGLELVVTGLYWWHPAVWWARHEIREAEEQCCDAWVVWALPQAARAYATALLETVNFLGEAQPAMPPVVSGIGHVHTLKRRLTMIMRGRTPRALSWTGCLAVLGLGTILLPWLPTTARSEKPQSDPPAEAGAMGDTPEPAWRRHVELSANAVCLKCHQANSLAQGRAGNAHDLAIQLLNQVKEQRQQVHAAAAALERAQARLSQTEKRLREVLQALEESTELSHHPARPERAGRNWARGPFKEFGHDFGTVGHGSKPVHLFHLINTSGKPMHISAVRTSAGFVKATPLDTTLAPGEETDILVQVDTSRFIGPKTAFVYVDFDKPKAGQVRLEVKANSVAVALPAAPKARRRGQEGNRPAESAGEERMKKLEKALEKLQKEIDALRRQQKGEPVSTPPWPGPSGSVPYSPPPTIPKAPGRRAIPYIVPPGGGPAVPLDPFQSHYYAPTVPLASGDAKAERFHGDVQNGQLDPALIEELLKQADFYGRSGHPDSARSLYDSLRKEEAKAKSPDKGSQSSSKKSNDKSEQ